MHSGSCSSRPMPYSGWMWPPRERDHHVDQPAQVLLHRRRLRQAVERAHHEEGVAQPAEAVVPVAPAVGRLGDAGGHGGDDGAGVLEQRQLERDGGADHRVLPLQRQRQRARPVAPVVDGFLLEAARRVLDAGRPASRPAPRMKLMRRGRRRTKVSATACSETGASAFRRSVWPGPT